MFRFCRPCILLFPMLAGASAQAQAPPLLELHAQLAPMRATRGDSEKRGATPALMAVKHELRDWIEAHLSRLAENGDEQALAVRLNEELAGADLFCKEKDNAKDRCAKDDGEWEGTGFLEPLHFERQESGGLLMVRTGLGIFCGEDESAYLYEWHDGRWQRLWQTEQTIEPSKPYAPQFIAGLRASRPDDKTGRRLVMSLGYAGWCTSNWRRVFYRLWRVDPAAAAGTLLLDQAEYAYIGAHDPPLEGSVGTADALVELTIGSLDAGVHSYEAVRHYAISGDRIERIDPVALDPAAFTEEWLKNTWEQSAAWTPLRRRTFLRPWHIRFHADFIRGEYIGQPQRCGKTPDLWQVGIDLKDVIEDKSSGIGYFFVTWQPPYHFEMIDIRSKPRADCNQPAPPGEGLETLFPIQGWR
ncbi:MAG TPA: hypothetical protein VEI03_14135 [Stellaceae bacterium]|nr:hypothetical protein [Stellaceae bacterium]